MSSFNVGNIIIISMYLKNATQLIYPTIVCQLLTFVAVVAIQHVS